MKRIKKVSLAIILVIMTSCAGIELPPTTELFTPELTAMAVMKTIPENKRESTKLIVCKVSGIVDIMESETELDIKSIFNQNWDAETTADAQVLSNALINYLSKVKINGVGTGTEYHKKVNDTLRELCKRL